MCVCVVPLKTPKGKKSPERKPARISEIVNRAGIVGSLVSSLYGFPVLLGHRPVAPDVRRASRPLRRRQAAAGGGVRPHVEGRRHRLHSPPTHSICYVSFIDLYAQ